VIQREFLKQCASLLPKGVPYGGDEALRSVQIWAPGRVSASTLLTGTVFAKTRQRPATLVLLLRGIAKGEPTARLARELGLSRKQLHTLRQRIQANLNATAPTGVMTGTAFEADERYQINLPPFFCSNTKYGRYDLNIPLVW
jgi:hypothetical protein